VDFAVEDSRGHHVLTTFKTQKRGNRRRPEEESFTSGCRAPGILATRKSPTTGAPASRRGTDFLRTVCGLKGPPDNIETIIDPRDAAESAGLRYVSDGDTPGRRRKRDSANTRVDGARLSEMMC
jgi:hypothetical protein